MSITSFPFLCLFGVILILYYLIPKKAQWGLLLTASLGYFLLSGEPWLAVYPVIALAVIYFSALYIHRVGGNSEEAAVLKKKRIVLALAVVFCVFLLCILKYMHFGLLAPIGISFYTLTLLGYLFDVYYEISEAETNILKLGLFGYYFPTMISGPILRYKDLKDELFGTHSFDYKKVTFGIQRMLWGFFKKLVISERMALIVNEVFGKPDTYGGFYILIGAIGFTFQLYTDFSGCMDIIIGASETFGITLPENFKTPFFARNISEYWRRWHITLGDWLKDFLFYPILRTSFFAGLPKKLKGKLGKKRAKQYTVFLAMLLLWSTIGYWHGGAFKYIFGSGLLHWFYIVSGELLEPVWAKLKKWFHIKEEAFGFVLFQRIRTFLLVALGLTFFRAADFPTGCKMVWSGMTEWNPEIFWNGSVFQLGLDWVELSIAVISLVLLLLVSTLQERYGSVRELLAKQHLLIRWIVLYALLFYVILLGYYGPGYSASEFIYQGF